MLCGAGQQEGVIPVREEGLAWLDLVGSPGLEKLTVPELGYRARHLKQCERGAGDIYERIWGRDL
jgi:hypothetical protein